MGRKPREIEKGQPETVWRLTKHDAGYIRNRRGTAEVRYGPEFSRSLGMEFLPKNKSRAIQLGNQIVTDYKREKKASGVQQFLSAQRSPGREKIRTVRMAWVEFKRAQVDGMSRGSSLRYRHSFAAFFPDTDVPLDLDQLHDYLAERLAVLREIYANNTLVKFVMCQKNFFDYCRDRKLVDGNPLTLIKRPKLKRKDKIITYTETEEQRIVQWFLDRVTKEHTVCHRNRTSLQYANLWPFLSCSACRISEALSLRWSESVKDRTSENFVDMEAGCIVLNATKTGEERRLPIHLPGLRDVLERQRQFAIANKGYVFMWRDIQLPARMFKKCIEALATDPDETKRMVINTGPRPLHVFRATAEYRWKRRGWDDNVITGLAGHSKAVYQRDYETKFSYEELMARIPTGGDEPQPVAVTKIIQYKQAV